ISAFQPQALLFVGIAGALSDELALGDVVVATRVYAFPTGRSEENGFRARPHAWEAPHRLEQLARYTARTGNWNESGADRPAVHFRPIVTTDVALESGTLQLSKVPREHYGDAVAIEMESAGVAQAGQLNQSLPV